MKPEPAPERVSDGWFQSEEPTRLGLTFELRRIALRFWVRPLPALLIAAAITTGIAVKIVRKPKVYTADIILALTEGAVLSGKRTIPFEQLREYVYEVLLPDSKLLALIEDRNLFRLRHKFGPQYAIDELRGQLDITIWKNRFIIYDPDDYGSRKTARIGISVTDGDPELAYLLARDLASIVMSTHEEQRRLSAEAIARETALQRQELTRKLSDLAKLISAKQAAFAVAEEQGDTPQMARLSTDIKTLTEEEQSADDRLSVLLKSTEAMAEEYTAAGLGLRLDLLDEQKPERQFSSNLVLAVIVVVVGTGTLVGAAMFLGAFDSRVHDTDDVMRLGLPVLGHVPGFAGDRVGSLRARGARRGRVPWFLRWRSRR